MTELNLVPSLPCADALRTVTASPQAGQLVSEIRTLHFSGEIAQTFAAAVQASMAFPSTRS